MDNNLSNEKPSYDGIYRKSSNWKDLYFYQKSEVLYQMTVVFCKRFLPSYGDRTVDQMVQAARSGKQNIVEGKEDGKTSSEMEIKLLNVARSSIGELKEDYADYLKSHQLIQWTDPDQRYKQMNNFTRQHNTLSDYESYFYRWSAEEMANVGLTLCHQVDALMNKYLAYLETTFVEQGGIKERMYQARTGYRKQQEEHLAELERTVPLLQQQLQQAQADATHWEEQATRWQAAYEDLKSRALISYNKHQTEIAALKQEIERLRRDSES